ncbi:MAG: hypothetical protein JSS63_14410 [Bacteroidetes bacterium]|nr:hypothetical protein [Bacteroidota bacterium]
MKNLKVVVSLLPVLILGSFIYFSTIGFSNTPEKIEKKSLPASYKKPQGTCPITFHLLYVDATPPPIIKICINETYSFTTGEDSFTLDIPCDETTTICVWDGTFYGSVTITPGCSCELTDVNIVVAGLPLSCHCND